MVVHDVANALLRPQRRLPLIVAERGPFAAGGVVLVAGIVCGGVGLAATLVEPVSRIAGGVDGRHAGVILSLLLPVVLLATWLVDAWIVDAGARLMGAPSRRREYLVASGFAVPVLVGFELASLVASVLDSSGAYDAAVAVGYLRYAALAWYVVLLTLAARGIYELPLVGAMTAALLPYAAMTTVLLVVLVVLSAVYGLGGR
ncbi:MAG TPA: hypothetical protein VN193_04630 [Candidatus Angelobacter sp.]|jgi:hypothetical protein|nr:hypothetical protein [Candidatus Angelobacter sp.]